MHKRKFVLEKETNEILWDVVIQTDHLYLASRQDLVLINKKKELDVL